MDSIALKHSKMLCEHLSELINANQGKISFAQFMQQTLYAPGLGYYNCGASKFGQQGDFITAPELGPLFAKCVARQCAQILKTVNGSTILELGAGTGQLAFDLLTELERLNIKIERYLILEISADLKQRQQEKLKGLPIMWLEELPAKNINGVIIANEVIDAMPVHRFYINDNHLQEYYVTIKNGNFEYILREPSDELKQAFNLDITSQPYTSEINLYIPAWIKSLSECLNSGAILLFDYGFPAHEYYHPQRNAGTLMCHYQHRAHSDVFFYPGLQDITAHVDFSAVANAAKDNGLHIKGYGNLASFLLNCGIDRFVTPPITLQLNQELNKLCSPAEMGELFKVLILTRGVDIELMGFKSFDKQRSL